MNGAVISECGTYRYVLTRHVPIPQTRPLLFICLNPSTADASIDDPSIRRMKGFAASWGCTGLTVVNLFALRATDPRELTQHSNPVGPENDRHIAEQITAHSLGIVVAAWGAHPMAAKRARALGSLLAGVHCLGVTKDGSPRHPLYIRADQPHVPWTAPWQHTI